MYRLGEIPQTLGRFPHYMKLGSVSIFRLPTCSVAGVYHLVEITQTLGRFPHYMRLGSVSTFRLPTCSGVYRLVEITQTLGRFPHYVRLDRPALWCVPSGRDHSNVRTVPTLCEARALMHLSTTDLVVCTVW